MDKAKYLYQQICMEAGKNELSNADIEKICSFLQRNFSNPTALSDLKKHNCDIAVA